MDASDNKIRLEDLFDLISIQELNLNCNEISTISNELNRNHFVCLERLHIA